MSKYMASLLRDMFGNKLSSEPEVEVVHRVGPARKSGDRTMMVRLQRYRVKEEIIEISKKEQIFEAVHHTRPDGDDGKEEGKFS